MITLRNEEIKESFVTNFYEEVLPEEEIPKTTRKCKSMCADIKPKMVKVAK